MEHPAFAEAGSGVGIEIWTIDKFEPVPIEPGMYGKFYNGDSYIVLKTTGEDVLTHDAHFWLGSKTTQDKKGSAAIHTVVLDDMLGGRAVHHRETQGHETSLFLSYFRPAVRYLDGGNESGFNQVVTNAGAEKRLLKLKGNDNLRMEEVPADASSLNKDNCFILEVEHDIFVLIPAGSRATHRRKVISVANTLRDDYHNGRATIEIIDEFSSDDDVNMFFEALGSGSKDELEDDQSSDEVYSRASATEVYLYKVLTGEAIELVALSKPFKQKNLASDEVYILDTPCSGVYIWLGRGVDADVRKNYHDIVQQFLDQQGYPDWVHVTRVTEGAECSNFQQYFHSWDTVAATTSFLASESDAGYFSSDADEAAAAAYRIGKSAAARGYMPDQGDGSLVVTRIAGDQKDVTERLQGPVSVLYQTEVYVVKYQYTAESGDDAYVVYVWVGKDASDEDKQSAIQLAEEIDEEVEGKATVVQVPQGKEPKHFLSLFKGNLAVLFGSKDDEYKPQNSKGSYDDDNIRLFRVEGTETGVDLRAVQVEESAEVLEDDDVFVLETAGAVYVRNGKESDPQEQEAAQSFVTQVVGGEKEVIAFSQGEEPEEFWEALVTVSISGKIKFEELPPKFTQEDLSDDGLYILDVGEELYMWQGANIPERVKVARLNIIKEYILDDGLDRTPDTTLVVGVKQGGEPSVFRKLFPSWDDDMWTNQTSYDDIKNETKAANSK